MQKKVLNIRTIEIASLTTLLFITAAISLGSNIALATGLKPEHQSTIHFEAEITNITKLNDYPYLSKFVHMGDHIIGSVTYDLVTADDDQMDLRNAIYGYFSPSPFDITLKVNNFAFGTNPFKTIASITVYNNDKIQDAQTPTDNSHNDEFAIVSRGQSETILDNHSPVDRMGISQISIYFIDPSGKAISSDALPPYAPDLSLWTQHHLGINGPKDSGSFIGANITSTW